MFNLIFTQRIFSLIFDFDSWLNVYFLGLRTSLFSKFSFQIFSLMAVSVLKFLSLGVFIILNLLPLLASFKLTSLRTCV